MNKSSLNICQNCAVDNETPFQYCPNCGQKNTDGKITFSEIWSEFQDAVFNIESRTWRTFKSMFVPGKLTLEYFSGKHRRFVHPLRLLLVTSVLFIIAMSFQNFQSATNHGYNVKERILKNYERQRLYSILDKITKKTNDIYPEQQTEIITDTIMSTFQDSLWSLLFQHDNKFANRFGDRYSDSIDINHYVGYLDDGMEKVSKHDFLYLDEDEMISAYKKDASRLDRLIFKQKVKLINDESQLFATVIGYTTWAFLLMMPCLALILFLLYIRHNYYYVEHLIFTFHLQSFSFLVLGLLIVVKNIIPWWLFFPFFAAIFIYLFFSMLKVYNQGIGKTILKFLLFSMSYGAIFIMILLSTVFISFLML